MTGAIACAMLSIGCSKSSGSSGGSGSGLKVSAVSPAGGPDSTIVTIAGTGFSATATDDNVSFNGNQAVVISASTTQLQAMVPTLAGTGALTISVNGQTVTAETFSYDTTWRVTPIVHNLVGPIGLSIDAFGYLYFGTRTPQAINKVGPDGVVSSFASVSSATGTVIDAAGNVYASAFATADSSTISKISPAGVVSFFAGDSGQILGLALDAVSGNLYAANNSKNSVDLITPQGVVSVFASNLYYPSGITVTSDGTVYVNNYTSAAYIPSNGVITQITASGKAGTFVNIGKYDAESGMTTDGTNLYVTLFDQGSFIGSIARVSPSGGITTLVTGNGINEPISITRDHGGQLYVSNYQDTIVNGSTGSIVKLAIH
jgi:hypothetical protein